MLTAIELKLTNGFKTIDFSVLLVLQSRQATGTLTDKQLTMERY